MIHLSKDGIRYSNHYRKDCDKYVTKMVNSLVPYLREEVQLSEDYTLADLFEILGRDVDNYDIIFGSELGHHPFELFMNDINAEAPVIDGDDKMEFLEVQWTCECDDYTAKGYSWGKSIEFNTDFHGWGTWDDDENSPHPDGTKGGFAIEYTPLAELKHYPLKLKTKTKIYLDNGQYEEDETGGMNYPVLFEGEKCFSVYDFLSSILYEISWGGSPEDRDETFKEITDDVEEARASLEAGDDSRFKSFDELKKDLEK